MRDRPSTTTNHPVIKRIRLLSDLLDNIIPIPGTRFRFGIDPILGLIPGGGDIAGAILSAYIVFEAARLGLPRTTLVKMLTNLILDSAVGALPIVGDLFDITWKANSRNVDLMETHTRIAPARRSADIAFIVLLLVTLILILVGLITIATLLVTWLVNLVR